MTEPGRETEKRKDRDRERGKRERGGDEEQSGGERTLRIFAMIHVKKRNR